METVDLEGNRTPSRNDVQASELGPLWNLIRLLQIPRATLEPEANPRKQTNALEVLTSCECSRSKPKETVQNLTHSFSTWLQRFIDLDLTVCIPPPQIS